MSPELAGRFLPTGPPRKSLYSTFRLNSYFYSEAEVLFKPQILVQGCGRFLGLPKINHHKLGALKQQKFILSVLKARSLKSRCGQDHTLSDGSIFWWLLAFLDV